MVGVPFGLIGRRARGDREGAVGGVGRVVARFGLIDR
jgi:hypothetical protein